MVLFNTKIIAENMSKALVSGRNVPFKVLGQMFVSGVVIMYITAFMDALNTGNMMGAGIVLGTAFGICLVVGLILEGLKNRYGINLYDEVAELLGAPEEEVKAEKKE